MTCQNGTCEIEAKVRQELALSRTEEEIQYGKLWAESYPYFSKR